MYIPSIADVSCRTYFLRECFDTSIWKRQQRGGATRTTINTNRPKAFGNASSHFRTEVLADGGRFKHTPLNIGVFLHKFFMASAVRGSDFKHDPRLIKARATNQKASSSPHAVAPGHESKKCNGCDRQWLRRAELATGVIAGLRGPDPHALPSSTHGAVGIMMGYKVCHSATMRRRRMTHTQIAGYIESVPEDQIRHWVVERFYKYRCQKLLVVGSPPRPDSIDKIQQGVTSRIESGTSNVGVALAGGDIGLNLSQFGTQLSGRHPGAHIKAPIERITPRGKGLLQPKERFISDRQDCPNDCHRGGKYAIRHALLRPFGIRGYYSMKMCCIPTSIPTAVQQPNRARQKAVV
ncbi:hypothetical protein BD779DRAFT_1474734 [Infundibulicybe gibba]|nr:hypothetical protein BD779DRAFT_1474734 [Infundibulicybe gibba]